MKTTTCSIPDEAGSGNAASEDVMGGESGPDGSAAERDGAGGAGGARQKSAAVHNLSRIPPKAQRGPSQRPLIEAVALKFLP
jgi:hypothetical protein